MTDIDVSALPRYSRTGRGAPMLLIHGIGHRHKMWDPVIPTLADHFDTVAIDLPGFGESDPLGDGDAPTPARLADRVELVMDELGWDSAHLVGNSLGGWLSLELARRGRATSVCALMPAGLWRSTGGTARVRRQVLFSVWVHGSRVPGAGFLLRRPLLRTVALFGLFGRPWRIPSVVAADDARNLATCDFDRTMSALEGTRFGGGDEIDVPITVVYGGRDPLIRAAETDLDGLPSLAAVIVHEHLGHVPTWDDPDLVAAVIRGSTTAS
ncbi:alpha/beta fold hydrolase [Rhodococcus sp. SORGH_AS_0303]|uniref:alpha/beta fold hydrolase n=1 Tax=Rhodococcus sp. SORGH_AS_0303 TaxID=3041753 RepID=UPI002788A6E7|nr:alpha/beta fold hydrolase [Rhodococcus sp. SORGH_AS_0303]MDQ1203126.1 pimeloyl-ACP methyl ester carboxylesterase [Rhodococcus sp. SORGH_AS_0303]